MNIDRLTAGKSKEEISAIFDNWRLRYNRLYGASYFGNIPKMNQHFSLLTALMFRLKALLPYVLAPT